ncbi:hypothetical protein TSTA_061240 [Talaromyces stipitatus ATCC 10500]|uniref:Uncharacterized protein n=1 Tax=Talaromyces stipitatus (strain ATCC 10500 / CBS 375.48 / QM 6759 / NRRL 1006) TaxID=441959 RepID=B8LV12_TALSN|nr:uncharacterized protein TSTA_061240 [Talaromyces stipitatus ATCC 10500]EED22633.1 hypothetical protein TSTA_061240 [Talaromyces stipitatus ATCC 10500]
MNASAVYTVPLSYGICPGTQKDILGVPILIEEGQANIAANGSCDALTHDVYYGQFGIATADNGTYLDVKNLPSNHTKALSNIPGLASLTSPPGGEIMTVTFLNKTYTVTATPYNTTKVSATTSSSGDFSRSALSSSSAVKPASATTTRFIGAAVTNQPQVTLGLLSLNLAVAFHLL